MTFFKSDYCHSIKTIQIYQFAMLTNLIQNSADDNVSAAITYYSFEITSELVPYQLFNLVELVPQSIYSVLSLISTAVGKI